jgi:hypothetical protein
MPRRHNQRKRESSVMVMLRLNFALHHQLLGFRYGLRWI